MEALLYFIDHAPGALITGNSSRRGEVRISYIPPRDRQLIQNGKLVVMHMTNGRDYRIFQHRNGRYYFRSWSAKDMVAVALASLGADAYAIMITTSGDNPEFGAYDGEMVHVKCAQKLHIPESEDNTELGYVAVAPYSEARAIDTCGICGNFLFDDDEVNSRLYGELESKGLIHDRAR